MSLRPLREFTESADGFWYGPDIDKGDEKDYQADLSCLLLPGDTLASAAWGAESGIEIVLAKNTTTAISATVWLRAAGATVGASYLVSGIFATTQGRIFKRSFKVRCRNL